MNTTQPQGNSQTPKDQATQVAPAKPEIVSGGAPKTDQPTKNPEAKDGACSTSKGDMKDSECSTSGTKN